MVDTRIRVVLPAVDDDQISGMLRRITAAIDTSRGETGGYGLGGSGGYGAHWSTDLFQMHPYCWCDSQACPWCMGCDCPDPCAYHSSDAHQAVGFEPNQGAPNFWHKPSGIKVWWYKYIGRGMETRGNGDLLAIERECLAETRLSPQPLEVVS